MDCINLELIIYLQGGILELLAVSFYPKILKLNYL